MLFFNLFWPIVYLAALFSVVVRVSHVDFLLDPRASPFATDLIQVAT
jgi:hypothetical protein